MRVKLSVPGAPANLSLDEFGGVDNVFDGVHIGINDGSKEADLWFILDNVVDGDNSCLVNPNNVFWFSAECAYPMDFYQSRTGFLNQFARLFTFYNIDLPTVVKQPPFLPWMINANHGYSSYPQNGRDSEYFRNAVGFPKSFDLSVICSNKTMTPEHAMRFEFVQRLKSVMGDRLHWFGNGINPIPDKFAGIAPYRHHLAIENKFENDIFTEKILDPFLGLSFPIYAGAPNLGDYFPADSFKAIDITDFDESLGIIENTIYANTYRHSVDALIEAKRRVLKERNLFKRFAKIAKDYHQDGSRELVTLSRSQGGYS